MLRAPVRHFAWSRHQSVDATAIRADDDAMSEILIVGRELVRQLLSLDQCIGLMEQAFRAASDGSAVQGLRGITPVPGGAGGVLGVMPGALTEPPRFGVKVISVL